jgi:hypothetical protein
LAARIYPPGYKPVEIIIPKRELPWRSGAEKVMSRIMHLKDAWPFLSPVDPNIAPDYFDVISTPMDLGTIHDNLVNDRYR